MPAPAVIVNVFGKVDGFLTRWGPTRNPEGPKNYSLALASTSTSVKCSASQIVAKIGVIVASLVNIVYSDRWATDMTILRRALSGVDSRTAVFANYAALVTIGGAAFQARDLAWL
jgi:hypothetical protein